MAASTDCPQPDSFFLITFSCAYPRRAPIALEVVQIAGVCCDNAVNSIRYAGTVPAVPLANTFRKKDAIQETVESLGILSVPCRS